MAVDEAMVRRVARLARIAVSDDELPHLAQELSAILSFVEELGAVEVADVPAMTSVIPTTMKMREDVVRDGGDVEAALANAPAREGDFYVVPKVVE